MALKDSLKACYELDGDATDETGSYDGAATSVSYASGKVGNCGVFNGTSAFIDTNYTPSANCDLTVSAWVKWTSTADMAIANNYGGAVNGIDHFYLYQTSNRVRLLVDDGADTAVAEHGSALNDGNWHHVVATYEYSTKTAKLYIDGALSATDTTAGSADLGQRDFWIGRARQNYSGDRYFSGSIDQVAMWERVLSLEEIEEIYNGGSGLAFSRWDLNYDSFSTLSAFNAIKADGFFVSPVRLLKIEFSSTTLFFCDRVFGTAPNKCIFNSQIYEPLVLAWDSLGLGPIKYEQEYQTDPCDWSFTIDNTVPVGSYEKFSDIFNSERLAYATVTAWEIFEGASAAGDMVRIFQGQAEEMREAQTERVVLLCSSYELAVQNKFAHEICNLTDFPNASPNDLGKMLPVVYGRARRVPLVGIDVGAITTLAEDINSVTRTVLLTDATNLPASGSVVVGAETISYAGKLANNITGCTRGVGASSAAAHGRGEDVAEATGYIYAIGHPAYSIGTIYIDNVATISQYVAYTGRSGDEETTYGGRACFVFSGPPTIVNPDGSYGFGKNISADIDGQMDDGDGTYTGVENGLIDRPSDICRHILGSRCGLGVSVCDSASYQLSREFYVSKHFEIAIAILQKPNVRSLINRIAYQSASLEFWEAGYHYLVYIGGN